MTDWMPRNPIITAVRWIFAMIDQVVYGLLSIMYQIFFTVSSVDFLSGNVLRTIYARVQIILGVFMIFKLSVTIIQGIVNPDTVLDKKRGMGTIVSRIIISLLMLSLMAPLNISATNEWEKQVNNHGILFGTLFSLQNRILSNNTIGRLIIGPGVSEQMTTPDNLSKVGSLFSSTVLKTFIFPNVVSGTNNKVCPNISSDVLNTYNNSSSSPGEILSLINVGCESEGGLFANIIGSGKYAFSYFLGLSTIAGIVIVVILIGYCVDVAVRVFKLAILRLIAPVPIISHINISAKEGKGEDSFSLWTKALISTYLDLFIRLAVIYLVLFFVQTILINGIQITTNYGSANIIIKAFTTLFIIIGLMFFAKQAPKYIKDVLGFKGGPSIGMTAMTSMIGNLRGGNDWKKSWDATSETVAEKALGDKGKGKTGFFDTIQNTSKAVADKISDKAEKGMVTEYYKRALDIDESVGSNYTGADQSANKGKWWQTEDAQTNLTTSATYKNNYRRYAAQRAQTPDLASGRGNTIRGSINTNTTPVQSGNVPTTAPTSTAPTSSPPTTTP